MDVLATAKRKSLRSPAASGATVLARPRQRLHRVSDPQVVTQGAGACL